MMGVLPNELDQELNHNLKLSPRFTSNFSTTIIHFKSIHWIINKSTFQNFAKLVSLRCWGTKQTVVPYSFLVLVPSERRTSMFGRSLQSEPGARGICCILAATRGLISLHMWSLRIGWCCLPRIYNGRYQHHVINTKIQQIRISTFYQNITHLTHGDIGLSFKA